MADSGKFTADPARVGAAQDAMDGLSQAVSGLGDRFFQGLDGYQEILKGGEFGTTAGEQLEQQRTQLLQACTALAKVLGAVPEAFKAQQAYLNKTQQGMIDSIQQSASKQY